MRVTTFLNDNQVRFDTLVHAPAFTAQKRAQHLHLPGRQVAKCVLLRGPRGHFLAILPATDRIDLHRLSDAEDGPVRLAADGDIADVFRDCEWGVVSPFGSFYGLPTYVDEQVDSATEVVFECEARGVAIRMRVRDFERLEHPRRIRFAVPIRHARLGRV